MAARRAPRSYERGYDRIVALLHGLQLLLKLIRGAGAASAAAWILPLLEIGTSEQRDNDDHNC